MQGTPAPGWPARPLQLPQRHKSPSALLGSCAVGMSFRTMARPVICLLRASPPSPSDVLPEQGRMTPHSLHELLAHRSGLQGKVNCSEGDTSREEREEPAPDRLLARTLGRSNGGICFALGRHNGLCQDLARSPARCLLRRRGRERLLLLRSSIALATLALCAPCALCHVEAARLAAPGPVLSGRPLLNLRTRKDLSRHCTHNAILASRAPRCMPGRWPSVGA